MELNEEEQEAFGYTTRSCWTQTCQILDNGQRAMRLKDLSTLSSRNSDSDGGCEDLVQCPVCLPLDQPAPIARMETDIWCGSGAFCSEPNYSLRPKGWRCAGRRSIQKKTRTIPPGAASTRSPEGTARPLVLYYKE